jgi:hypothetical protein
MQLVAFQLARACASVDLMCGHVAREVLQESLLVRRQEEGYAIVPAVHKPALFVPDKIHGDYGAAQGGKHLPLRINKTGIVNGEHRPVGVVVPVQGLHRNIRKKMAAVLATQNFARKGLILGIAHSLIHSGKSVAVGGKCYRRQEHLP